MNQQRLNGIDFWTIKHQIDDEAKRLNWSKLYCKQFIICNYGCRSRLHMTDAQLLQLLDELKSIPTPKRLNKASKISEKGR